MRARHYRVFGFQVRALLNKYGAALFALLSFFVEGISRSPFGHIFGFGKSTSLRARAGSAIIDESD
jgi:hypothetical protein